MQDDEKIWVVFISDPYRSLDPEMQAFNVRRAQAVAEQWWFRGHVVVCLHGNIPDALPCSKVRRMVDEVISRVDAVVMMEGWQDSAGSRRDRMVALARDKAVVYDQDQSS